VVLTCCEIRLRTGFFKRVLYAIEIGDKQLILKPLKEGQSETITVSNDGLVRIGFAKRGPRSIEVEIGVKNALYVGTLVKEEDADDLISKLAGQFGDKLMVE